MAFGGGGEGSVIFKWLATGSLTTPSECMSNTKWTWSVFSRVGGHRGGRDNLGEMGGKCDWSALNEIPK